MTATSRARRRPAWDPEPPLWVTRLELRPLAQRLAQAARRELIYLEQSDPIGVVADRARVEDQIRAVLAAGWRPPPAPVSTVDGLEALPVGTVVTGSDGHVWIRNQVGQWCEPYPAGIDPDELLADGPVTVQCTPGADAQDASATPSVGGRR